MSVEMSVVICLLLSTVALCTMFYVDYAIDPNVWYKAPTIFSLAVIIASLWAAVIVMCP